MNQLKTCILTLFLFFNLGTVASQAQCQLCYLTEEQAQTVVNYLSIKNEMIVYAGCANNDLARLVNISKVSYRPSTDQKGYFEIYAQGVTTGTFYIQNQKPSDYAETNMKFEAIIDIAYIHIRTGGFKEQGTGKSIWDATCLGIYLGYDCDPCIDPFDYPMMSHN